MKAFFFFFLKKDNLIYSQMLIDIIAETYILQTRLTAGAHYEISVL
jgi:hypothetical protein